MKHGAITGFTVHLLRGDDPVLLGDELRRVTDEVVAGGDRALMVEEVDETDYLRGDTPSIAALVEAAQTPPFLTERRVIVGRHLARFTTNEAVAPLVAYLTDPLPSTSLVLVWEKGPEFTGRSSLPKSLDVALEQAGVVKLDTGLPSGAKGRETWLREQLAHSEVSLDTKAQKQLLERLGEDLNRLGAILEVLEATYGPGATVGPRELAPFLGEAGGVPTWELTDAIAAGDIATALERLTRMLGSGERHALQVMATLHSHVGGLMRLSGASVASAAEAATLLGMKSTFPAEKLLRLARRLGPERIAEQVHLLAQADLDLRGASEWPDELVLEVLVARLARLSSAR